MARAADPNLLTLDMPAVRVDGDALLLDANPDGARAFERLDAADLMLLQGFLIRDIPFELILDGPTRLTGEPTPDGTVLQWSAVSDAEIRLSLFRAVARSVNSSLILEDIFDDLGEILRSFIPFSAGTIVILDDSQNRTKVVVRFDETGQAELHGDNPVFAGYDPILRQMLERPVAHQQAHHPDDPPSVLIQPEAPLTLLAPLINKGMVIGVIGLSGIRFTEMQLHLLSEVSEQLAVAVENARLYWQTQSQAGREFLINQITRAIRQTMDIGDILATTVGEVGRVMGLSRCRIDYWGTETEAAATRPAYEYVLPGILPVEQSEPFADLVRHVFLNRTDPAHQYNPFVLNDARGYAPAEALLAGEQICSMAVFPILLQESQFVGAISLHQCDTFRAWLAEEIELLKAIGAHVAVALHQAGLFQETETQRRQLAATLDELQQTQMHLIQSEKMAVLGQFVAGIAHEVNTPLGTMRANDDTVRHCLEKLTPDAATEKYRQSALDLLAINRLASERIQDIVRNLRNFARLDESDLKSVDLREGLDSTLLLTDSTRDPQICIEKEYLPDLPPIECFPGLLNQVWMNLIVNAMHSIAPPGRIIIRTGWQTFGQTVAVSVTDTGKGIAPEHLSRIFDPGFTTKGVGVGTGLGLALCYRIIEKHNGRITADSHVGQGTTLTVTLPVHQVLTR